MIKNKTTLIIDGNWLMMSRLGVIQDKFQSDLPEKVLEGSYRELVDFLAQSVNKIINFFDDNIDNIIMVQDNGSWRKSLKRPKLYTDTYKGNRIKDAGMNWDWIWKALQTFCESFNKMEISCFRESGCEGDDWCWHWSKTLNKNGINSIIWSSDRDLQQLVSYNKNKTWTVWYNDRAGLVCHRDLAPREDLIEDMLSLSSIPSSFEYLKDFMKSHYTEVHFINPLDIAMEKIICGDSGDNIKAVMRVSKGERIARVSEKEWNQIKETYEDFQDLDDFKKTAPMIIEDLHNLKRFAENKDSEKDLLEMFMFNMKLVCLDSKYIPKDNKNRMASHNEEYKLADLDAIRDNYKVLALNDDVEVEELFDIF